MTINTYLTFNGTCEEAFNFYKSVFGGEFTYISRFDQMPDNPKYKIAKEDENRVMHVSYSIGNSVLMGSDTGGEWAANYKEGNNFSISLNTDSKAEADNLFTKLYHSRISFMLINNFLYLYI